MSIFDIIILGSGPGGYVAAIRAAQLGMKVAIIEKEALGGICLNWGCIPTKALLKSAQVYHYLLDAESFGLKTKKVDINFESIIQRSRNVAETMSKGVKFLMKKNKISVIEGYGKVKPGKTIEVTDIKGEIKEYKALHIIIATGGRAKTLGALTQDNQVVFDYKKAMTLKELPQSMIIVGAGAIGCEFAYFYQSMGVKVTLIEFFNRIVPNEDEEISQSLQKSFTKMGMKILTTSRVMTSKIQDNKAILIVSTPDGEVELKSEAVLSAAGIVANIDNIGLEYSGIILDNGKIKTDDFYRTNIDGFYAIGDVTKGPALAHVASAEGILCVEKIAGLNPPIIRYDNIPACTYTQPEIASVGWTEAKAKEAGYDILVGRFPFTASGKAQTAGQTDGFVKMIYDKKYGELLGAHMIGANVTELIAEIVVARNLETTGKDILYSIHPHPTMSEAIMEATAAAYGEAIHL
ncbi:MAG TPA: dihydrolipoyl dehydrogenase [Chitinophagales bacterium]|nr:dihydrolipoyl dehydrogenase [Chitinophagales bacterium]